MTTPLWILAWVLWLMVVYAVSDTVSNEGAIYHIRNWPVFWYVFLFMVGVGALVTGLLR